MMSAAFALLAAAQIVTLDEAVQSAREHQPQLRQARANTAAAGARASQALAPLLPQLSAMFLSQPTMANFSTRPGQPIVRLTTPLIPTPAYLPHSPTFLATIPPSQFIFLFRSP